MAEENSRLTPEQLKRLGKVLEDATSLTSYQLEIIDKILEGEMDIGDIRIAYLKDYFDIYSSRLNDIAKKQSSINEGFLIIQKKLLEAERRLKSLQNSSSPQTQEQKTNKKPKKVLKSFSAKKTIKPVDHTEDADIKDETSKVAPSKKYKITKKTKASTKVIENSGDAVSSEISYTDPEHKKSPKIKISSAWRPAATSNSEQVKKPSESEEGTESPLSSSKPNEFFQAQKPNKEADSVDTEDVEAADEGPTDAVSESGPSITPSEDSDEEDVKVFNVSSDVDAVAQEERFAEALEKRLETELKLNEMAAFWMLQETERENERLRQQEENLDDIIEYRIKCYEELAEKQDRIDELSYTLAIKRANETVKIEGELYTALENAVADERSDRMVEMLEAGNSLQDKITSLRATLAFMGQEATDIGPGGGGVSEAGAIRAEVVNTEQKSKVTSAVEEEIIRLRTSLEEQAKAKNGGVLSPEDATRINKILSENFSENSKKREKFEAQIVKKEQRENRESATAEYREQLDTAIFKAGVRPEKRLEALKQLTTDDATGKFSLRKTLYGATTALANLAKNLENKVDEIARLQTPIDTRMQGSSAKQKSGSYWEQMTSDMASVGAINPYFKQEDFGNSIAELVNKGIAFNVTQRAFLNTIKDKIASTFNVFDSTLMRLIRIQQEDSTAGRLGMESALNTFLNEMYETSEYLSGTAEAVRANLQEMLALQKGDEATEIEFEVQKWLGSLYSVGMSDSAVQSISTSLGQIASGQIEGIIQGGASNLLIMAANEAGYSIADILTDGIDTKTTNDLLKSAVEYLADLAESSKDNKVVQQQLASVFGVQASDLRAATNLVTPGSVESIYAKSMSYAHMIQTLNDMASTMGDRTSMAEIMTNIWENGQYTLASSLANSPISYFIYKMASVLDTAVGGIPIPFFNVYGFGADLETTVADLMRVGALSGAVISNLGAISSGLGNSFDGRSMLSTLGIGSDSGLSVTPRGGGSGKKSSGKSTSGSGSGSYAGNSSSSDVVGSTQQSAEDSKKEQMIEAVEERESNKIDTINETVLKIYELLDKVSSGDCLKVKVAGYGLTKSSTSLGGISSIADSITNNNSSNKNGGNIGDSDSVISNLTLGGWSTNI